MSISPYVGHILVREDVDSAIYCSNAELLLSLRDMFHYTWSGPCDEYEHMETHLEYLCRNVIFRHRFKYVIGTMNTNGPLDFLEMAVVFDASLPHSCISSIFDRVLHAGFVKFAPNSLVAYGESLQLKKYSGPTDIHVLKRCLGDKYWRGKF